MKKQMVVKSNNLVEARYKLRLEEQRLMLYLISIIEPHDEAFKEYRISVNDFCTYTGLRKDNVYDSFLEMSDSLVSKTIRIKEHDSITTLAWLAQTTYHKGEGVISICFAPKLKPYLMELKKNFTIYSIENVLKLKSIHSVRLYELLKQYEKIGERVFNILDLKDILCVKEMYSRYYDFKKYAIVPAHKELKEKCDIYFEFEEIKEGRRVAKIKFLIYQNENKKKKACDIAKKATKRIVSVEHSPQKLDLTAELGFITEKLTDKELLSIWDAANGDAKLIHKRYDAVKRKKDVNNLVGFLLWAIEHPDENFETIKSNEKNKFINYESRKVDFAEIERLEREKLMKEYKQSLEA